MRVLTLNTGSSSLKYRLSEPDKGVILADGLVERIGASEASIEHTAGGKRIVCRVKAPNHKAAFNIMLSYLTHPEFGAVEELGQIEAVGHRVVHGGDRFFESVEIDPDVIQAIEEFEELAPLHNPINLLGIRIAKEFLPDVPHVAVFDTAFHQTMPVEAHTYALPIRFYRDHRIRRYGFHGTSHRYVSRRAAQILSTPLAELRMITCHLGNGCSLAAIKGGRSIDTSMGFTPLEGLVMGTRSGDIDPSIVFYLVNRRGYDLARVEEILNRESGLLGLSGISNDMKVLIDHMKHGSEAARLAVDVFVYRVKKYIGAYAAILGGLDCLVFTAGIGERSPLIRERICRGLEHLGIEIDAKLNQECVSRESIISPPHSRVKVVVIPTDEEAVIAEETYNVVKERCRG